MKRYDLESTGWDHEEMVERPLGDWCEWDEVDTERAKDKEEIKRLKKTLGKAGEWLRDADSQIVEYDHGVPYDIIGIAKQIIREALEGRKKKVRLIGGDECEEDLGMLPRMPNKKAELEGE